MNKSKQYAVTAAEVLIIDDDKSLLFTAKSVIEGEGHHVRTASNGRDGLSMVDKKIPDIIILDLMMPELNGYEVCQRLKNVPASENIPVIFLSSHGSPEEKVKAFEAGGVDYVVKPYSTLELLIRLRTHLMLQNIQNVLSSEVEKRTEELKEKNRELRETNLVLKRLIHEIEKEKTEINHIMQNNIERLILPDLSGMVEASMQKRRRLRDSIRATLLDLSSPVVGEHTEVYTLLTPTELRVLNLIRQGRSSKEIAEALHISPQTVATHRKKIRKKLHISGKKINLNTFVREQQHSR